MIDDRYLKLARSQLRLGCDYSIGFVTSESDFGFWLFLFVVGDFIIVRLLLLLCREQNGVSHTWKGSASLGGTRLEVRRAWPGAEPISCLSRQVFLYVCLMVVLGLVFLNACRE